MLKRLQALKKIKRIILISSIKSRKELPLSFKSIGRLHLDKIITKELCIKTFKFWGKNHGFKTISEKELFKSMLEKQTNSYLQWALRELSFWKEPKIPSTTKLIQIHGTKDKTFPFRLIKKPDFVIEDGSHILVHKQAAKISEILIKEIATLE